VFTKNRSPATGMCSAKRRPADGHIPAFRRHVTVSFSSDSIFQVAAFQVSLSKFVWISCRSVRATYPPHRSLLNLTIILLVTTCISHEVTRYGIPSIPNSLLSYQHCPPRNSTGRQSYVGQARCQVYVLSAITSPLDALVWSMNTANFRLHSSNLELKCR
jgi:hypothetical protein